MANADAKDALLRDREGSLGAFGTGYAGGARCAGWVDDVGDGSTGGFASQALERLIEVER